MGLSGMRTQALAAFQAGVAAADPYKAVVSALSDAPVQVQGTTYLLAIGKAAGRMAKAALACLDGPVQAIVVTNTENAREIAGARVFAAGHPVPDAVGEGAAKAMIELLEQAAAQDQVLALISGGGSALLPAPVAGITLADKAKVSRLLLASGADIGQMNMLRQQLSRLKGGGLLRLAAPAPVRALILSDVVGDDLRLIASGPTASPVGTRQEAVGLLKTLGIWQQIPARVKTLLNTQAADLPPLPQADNQLVGTNAISVAAMKQALPEAVVYHQPLAGDVARAAEIIADSGKGITLFGGETTVKLTGTGQGGRNQELALRVALLAEREGWEDWVFLSGGTDGRDGPSDAAGGLVDCGSLARMRTAGISPQAMLTNNDSYHALKAAGDLLITGATGTNVADLQVLIRA